MRPFVLLLVAMLLAGCGNPSVGAIREIGDDPAMLVADAAPTGSTAEWVAILKDSSTGCLLVNEEGPDSLLTTTVWPPGSRIVDGGVEVNGEMFEVGTLVFLTGRRLHQVTGGAVERCAETEATAKTTPIWVATVRRG